jgi:hypothetical protein
MTDRRDNCPPPEGWAIPSRDVLYPREWAGPDDDPETIIRGEN